VTVPSSGPSSGPMGVRSGSMDLSVMSKMPIKKRMIREDTESDPKIAALQYMRQQMEMMYPGVWNRHHWNEYHAYSMALEDTAVYTGFLGLENYDTRRNYLLSMVSSKIHFHDKQLNTVFMENFPLYEHFLIFVGSRKGMETFVVEPTWCIFLLFFLILLFGFL
jgi:hypothetical protein